MTWWMDGSVMWSPGIIVAGNSTALWIMTSSVCITSSNHVDDSIYVYSGMSLCYVPVSLHSPELKFVPYFSEAAVRPGKTRTGLEELHSMTRPFFCKITLGSGHQSSGFILIYRYKICQIRTKDRHSCLRRRIYPACNPIYVLPGLHTCVLGSWSTPSCAK